MAKWRQYMEEIERRTGQRVKAAATHVQDEIIASFGDSGIAGATKAQRRANPSRPGEPPHRDTSHLAQSIDYELTDGGLGAKVGSTNVEYSVYLELGTSKMAPRPYLRPALDRSRAEIKRILTKPMPPQIV